MGGHHRAQDSAESYGSELRIFLTIAILAFLGNVPDGSKHPITLLTSCPPGLFNQVAKNIQKAFLLGEDGNRDGKWTIHMSTEKQPKSFYIQQVVVLPEGVPAFSAYAFDRHGNPLDLLFRDQTKQVVVLDLGYSAASSMFIDRDQITHSDFHRNGYGGLKHFLHEPALTLLRATTGAHDLHPGMIDLWLRQWTVNQDNRTVRVQGQPIILDDLFMPLVHDYSQWVRTQLVQPALAQGAQRILVTGGGWHLALEPVMRHLAWKQILIPRMLPIHIPRPHYHQLNAYGGLTWLAMQRRQSHDRV
ncbi:MAG: hypothetical protein K8L99_10845 [Anaerolineae bacterium]|nr:hypothetical protein [Anaerolineae bacterium]